MRGTVCVPENSVIQLIVGSNSSFFLHSVSNEPSFHDRWALWFLGAEFRKSYGRLVAIGVAAADAAARGNEPV